MLRKFSILFALALTSLVAAQDTGEPFKPGKLPPAAVAALASGLTLRFYAKADDAKPLDARRVRLAALHIPKDTPPSPFIAPGPVHGTLSGYLKNPLKGDCRFRLTGTGTIVLRINGKEVAKNDGKEAEVELAKNYNRIEIIYASPSNGDSTLRLDWAGEKFGFEPLPPELLFSRKDDTDLVVQTALREGRQLYAERHCASCHKLPGKLAGEVCKMPELQSKAPSLRGASSRLKHDWLVAWMLNPRALRPEATMPSVLTGPDADKQAADIAAFLGSLKEQTEVYASADASSKRGEAMFKTYGCNTCHRLSDPKENDDLGRLSLYHIAAKMPKHSLADFLQRPHRRNPWSRMPDFRLKADDAVNIEKFLLENAKGTIKPQPPGDAKRGEKLFGDVGCARCHHIDDGWCLATTYIPPDTLESLDKGCLADKDRGKAPDFGLKAEQRSALAAFLKTDGKSLTRETPAEFSLRQVKSLRCDSCHRRDGELTRWHVVLEDDGKLPENLPSLTWVGEKLKPAWTKKLFAGQSDHSARPWIKARMPAFPVRADMLAVGLSHEHGFGIDEDDRPKPDAQLAAIGAKLIPQQGGFNCNNCHGIGKQPPIQPFEAPGINLLDAAVRLRYNYYQRWMLAPDRVDVTMRMPIFATDGKTTQIRDVFDGDARKQYDALWHYIQTLPAKK
jgi:mono/diheme cytochrome c family protein